MGASSCERTSNRPRPSQRCGARAGRVFGAASQVVPSRVMPRPLHKPEILAPAGDAAALAAALAAGADAVYFGLREGFNARARTGNFALADLAATVARIHRAGAKAHLAVNTLVFEPE